MGEVRRAIAPHPETPDALLKVLEKDLDAEVREKAEANIRSAADDLACSLSEDEALRLLEIYQADLKKVSREAIAERGPDGRPVLHGGFAIFVGICSVADAYDEESIGVKAANALSAAYSELHKRFEGRGDEKKLLGRMERVAEFVDGVNPEIKRPSTEELATNVADVELMLMNRRRLRRGRPEGRACPSPRCSGRTGNPRRAGYDEGGDCPVQMVYALP